MKSAIRGIGGARRPGDVGFARTGVERRLLPNKQKRIRCTPMHCLPICEKPKNQDEGKENMGKSYFDNPSYNVAFERCIDVLAELIEKYAGKFAMDDI